MLYFKIGGKEVHLLKLCGALILFVGVLGVISASATMWQSWNVINSAKKVLSNNPADSLGSRIECIDSVYKVTGACVSPKQSKIDATQYFIAMFGPIIMLLIWAAVFVFGWMVYNLGKTFIPIEEAEKKLADKPKPIVHHAAAHHKRR
jgi:hypothetical protein